MLRSHRFWPGGSRRSLPASPESPSARCLLPTKQVESPACRATASCSPVVAGPAACLCSKLGVPGSLARQRPNRPSALPRRSHPSLLKNISHSSSYFSLLKLAGSRAFHRFRGFHCCKSFAGRLTRLFRAAIDGERCLIFRFSAIAFTFAIKHLREIHVRPRQNHRIFSGDALAVRQPPKDFLRPDAVVVEQCDKTKAVQG